MNKDDHDVEVTGRETPFRGYFRIDRYTLRHRLFKGGWSAPMTREVFERGHAVGVLPYDPVLDQVVLIEQFRPGAYAANRTEWPKMSFSPWMVEVVAGIVEEGEKPEDVAAREMQEEAGVALGALVPISHYLASPGGSSESVLLYCGRVSAEDAGGIHGLDHEHEDIRVFTLPADEAFRWLAEGRIGNAMALIALQWLQINRDRLRRDWGTGEPGGA